MRKLSKRANGDGSISYEQDRKKYRAMITDSTGKRVSKRFDTKTEASQWLAEIRTDINREEYIATNHTRLGDWIIDFIETYKKPVLKPTSIKQMFKTAEYLNDLAQYELQDLDESLIQKFINNGDFPPRRKKSIKCLLKQSLDKAVDLQILRKNPVLKIKTPKIVRKHYKTLTKEEIAKILAALETKSFRYYSGVFKVMIYSGMRIGEIIGLKKESVHDKYIYINNNVVMMDGKNYEGDPKKYASKRKIALPKEIMDMLHELCQKDDSPYVFHNPKGQPFYRSNVSTAWTRLLKRCNIEHIRMHDARHTHATLLISQGIPLMEVSMRLGHAKVSTTLDFYAEYVNDYDTTLAEKLNTLLVAPTLHPTV